MTEYIERLKEMSLEQLLSELVIMHSAVAQEWKIGDHQNHSEFKAKAAAVKAHILSAFVHRGGESLAEVREWNKEREV